MLAGLRDPHLAAALKAMHAAPGACWTVNRLAQTASLSRSVFAERFAAPVGVTPMQYVGSLRMRLAGRLLAESRTTIATLADESGYASERAFRVAFQRHFGLSPAAWRRAAGLMD